MMDSNPPTTQLIQIPGGFITTDIYGVIQDIDHSVAILLKTSRHRLINTALESIIDPGSLDVFRDLILRSQATENLLEVKLNLRVREGELLPCIVQVGIFHNQQGRLAGYRWLIHSIQSPSFNSQDRITRPALSLQSTNAGSAPGVQDRINQLSSINERLEIELAERRRAELAAAQRALELSALNSATTALLKTLDLETLLGQILDAATSAIPEAEKGMLHLVARDTGQLEMRATIGYIDPRIHKFDFATGKGYVAKSVRERQPLLLHNIQSDPSLQLDETIEEISAIQSVVVAPLILGEDIIGALSLASSTINAFKDSDLELLVSFGNTATAAIRNAQLHAEVQKLAITDALTGLYNRRGFFELGRHEIERARRFSRPLSVIMLDLDFFKKVNDTYGHAAGDLALRTLAERIAKNVRDFDILGRYGGDEFTIMLTETDLFTSSNIAERLRQILEETPVILGNIPVTITASLGVVKSTADIHDLATLVEKADQAMYKAKQGGRNRVVVG
jgi:diguanylate cyclase (GGDEF)-like protein